MAAAAAHSLFYDFVRYVIGCLHNPANFQH